MGHVLAVLVKTNPDAEPRHRGMSLLLIEKGEGFNVSRKLEKLGYKGIDSGEFTLEDCKVPAENLIGGEEGRGLQHILGGLALVESTWLLAASAWHAPHSTSPLLTRRFAKPLASRSSAPGDSDQAR